MSNLDQKIAQAKAKLDDLQAQARKQNRRDEARRKILYGAAALALISELHGERRARYLVRLHAHINRQTDREFLGISVGDSQKTKG